jgi:hypothetical protein
LCIESNSIHFTSNKNKNMASIDPTLETLAPSKLLNYVQKDRLISPARYADLEQRRRQQLNKFSINLKDMKQLLATRPEFMQSIRQHAIGKEAFGKYQQAVQRLSNIDRTKSSTSRKVMTQPRNRYQGCLASRLKPEENYETRSESYGTRSELWNQKRELWNQTSMTTAWTITTERNSTASNSFRRR